MPRRDERSDPDVAQTLRDEASEEPSADDDDAPHVGDAVARWTLPSRRRRPSQTHQGMKSAKPMQA